MRLFLLFSEQPVDKAAVQTLMRTKGVSSAAACAVASGMSPDCDIDRLFLESRAFSNVGPAIQHKLVQAAERTYTNYQSFKQLSVHIGSCMGSVHTGSSVSVNTTQAE
jgi:hypothetical protein